YLLTVHDTLFLESKWSTIKEKIKFKHIPYSIKKADHIITVSNFLKTDLLKKFNLPENKISTVYCGINDSFYEYPKNASDMQSIKIKYALPENYILYVGLFNIRKNLVNLIKAFSLLKQKEKSPIKLVLVGKFDGKCEDIHKLIKELDIKTEVIFLDYMNNHELPYVYSLSTLFVFPSFYEGFGLPPLEAMASRVPVIASDIPVFQETLKDAALLVNPHDPFEIFLAMNKILNEKKLRLELIEKGTARAKNFSWQEAASKTIEIYNKL
ncbi:MAG: glycosyltransferase family 1 protein, partial [Candidatus Staskawiczbacteria bacterium]|nr:glycosyltransferase family 1 protein [Candidatus Staskawiczbacteria bacterium]